MKAILLSLVVLATFVALPQPAAAEPCEVPFCYAPGVAFCLVAEAGGVVKNYKTLPQTLEDCTTILA